MTRGINLTHWQRRKELKRSQSVGPKGPRHLRLPLHRPDLDVEKVETSVDLTSKLVVRVELKAKQQSG